MATKRWANGSWRTHYASRCRTYTRHRVPATLTDGWSRYFFKNATSGLNTYLSYPVFQSPLTSGRMIDLKNGVWENGGYTGRKVKVIVMPTLNNHCYRRRQ